MEIVRIGNDKNISNKTDRISFEHNGEKFTITPEHDGFRIHKHQFNDGGLIICPCCTNEVVVC